IDHISERELGAPGRLAPGSAAGAPGSMRNAAPRIRRPVVVRSRCPRGSGLRQSPGVAPASFGPEVLPLSEEALGDTNLAHRFLIRRGLPRSRIELQRVCPSLPIPRLELPSRSRQYTASAFDEKFRAN